MATIQEYLTGWRLVIVIVFVSILGLCYVRNAPETPPPTPTPTPTPTATATVTVPSGPPPVPHIEGQPHGLGITNQMVVEALVARGFAFEQDFNTLLQRPMVRGFASLGPYFTIWAIGSPPGVIEFTLATHWSRDAQPPVSTILSVVDLVTPNWEGASEWVSRQVDDLAGQDEVKRSTTHGNYVVGVYAYTLTEGEFWGIQVDVSPRFASCADALAAQDWTTQSSVGNERGYADWRVPLEPDPDGDRIVCESIL